LYKNNNVGSGYLAACSLPAERAEITLLGESEESISAWYRSTAEGIAGEFGTNSIDSVDSAFIIDNHEGYFYSFLMNGSRLYSVLIYNNNTVLSCAMANVSEA